MIQKEERDEDRRICEAATPGPWCDTGYYDSDADGPHIETEDERNVARCSVDVPEHSENGTFIAAARARWPTYIDALDEMERRLQAAEDAYAAALKTEDEESALPEGMLIILKILRGEP